MISFSPPRKSFVRGALRTVAVNERLACPKVALRTVAVSDLSQSRSKSLVKQKGGHQQGCNKWERYLRVEKQHGALRWLKQAEMLLPHVIP